MGCQNNTLLRSLTNNLSLRGRIRTFHPSAAALLPLFFSLFFLYIKKRRKIHFSFYALLFHFLISFLFRLFAFSFALAECRSYQFLAADWFPNGLTSANAGEEREMALLEGSPPPSRTESTSFYPTLILFTLCR